MLTNDSLRGRRPPLGDHPTAPATHGSKGRSDRARFGNSFRLKGAPRPCGGVMGLIGSGFCFRVPEKRQ